MDFSNEILERMEQKRVKYNNQYANWYKVMSEDCKYNNLWAYSETLIKKGERIRDCLNLWEWDVYHNNKLMDLQLVNRCKNNRFCPNCRKWDLSRAMNNLSKPLNKLRLEGYYPYLVTLTVPNVAADDLKRTIEKMNKAFRKLFGAFNYPLTGTTKGFSDRYIEVSAALKVLEITYNESKDSYHPHFHCMFFSTDYDESIFIKDIPGEWSNKRQSYNFYSTIDIQIAKLWTMFYNGKRVSLKNYNELSMEELYMCDIREMDSTGILEVLKYTFKDTDIVKYDVFKTIEIALERKRIRQGYGLLYNLKLEEESDGEKLSLSEFITEIEEAEKMYTKKISQLINEFGGYKKVSRVRSDDEFTM